MSPIHEHELHHAQKVARTFERRRALLEVLPIPALFAAIVGVAFGVGIPVDLWLWAVVGLGFYGGLGAWAIIEAGRRSPSAR